MKRYGKTSLAAGTAAVLCSLLALPSCSRDEISDAATSVRKIEYAVSCAGVGTSTAQVKCTTEEEMAAEGVEEAGGRVVGTFELRSEDGSLSLPVAVIESDGLPFGYESAAVTKGSLINGPDGADGYTGSPIPLSDSLSTFNVYACYTDDQSPVFAAADTVATYRDSRWVMGSAYYWPQTEMLDFYAYANLPSLDGAAVVSRDLSGRSQALTYTVPSDTDDQTDILMALYTGTGTAGGEAEIRFVHPLTAVQFSRKEMPEMTGVTNITMSGVHYRGRATQTMDMPTVITWEMLEDHTTTVVQDNDGKPFEVHGKIDGDPFLLIPQNSLSGYVELSVTVVFNGHNIPINAILYNMDWRTGKTYTYVIGYEGTLEIEFTSDPAESSAVTENAVVRNVGEKKCYVRAAATGYIKDGEGYVKSTWLDDDGNNKGTFTVLSGEFGSAGGWNANWVAGADGFWYYTKPLECSGNDEAAKKTTPLFDRYAITSLASGDHFELVVSAQAVEWDATKDYVTQNWGEEAAGLLE